MMCRKKLSEKREERKNENKAHKHRVLCDDDGVANKLIIFLSRIIWCEKKKMVKKRLNQIKNGMHENQIEIKQKTVCFYFRFYRNAFGQQRQSTFANFKHPKIAWKPEKTMEWLCMVLVRLGALFCCSLLLFFVKKM